MDRSREPSLLASAAGNKRPLSALEELEQAYRRAHQTHQIGAELPPRPAEGRAVPAAGAGSNWDAVALAYLVAISVAETTAVLVNIRLGTVLHECLLAVLLVHASFTDERRRPLLLALALAPLIRILSLSLPLQHVPLIYWYGIVALPLLASAFVAARTAGLTPAGLGIRMQRTPLQVLVAASGPVLGLTEFLILRPQPLIHQLTWGNFWGPAVILLVGTGVTEEVVFRGLMQSAGRPILGGLTVLYVSVVFAVLHIGYRSPLDFIFVLCVGLYFGYIAWSTRSIVGTSVSHGLANIMLYLVLPFVGLTGLGVRLPASPSIPLPIEMRAEMRATAMGARAMGARAIRARPPAGKDSHATGGLNRAAEGRVDPTQGQDANVSRRESVPSSAPGLDPGRAKAIAAAVAAAGSAVPTSAETGYIVQSGDSLSAIAARFGLSTSDLAATNGITDPSKIYAGQRLTLDLHNPGSPGTPPAAPVVRGQSSYTVQPGDTLGSIAARYGTTAAALAALNGIDARDRIYAGATLQVPQPP